MAPVSTEVERAGQIADELVGAGEADLGVVHAELGHALQQQHGVGHGDLEVRLLQAVAQAGVEQLDLWRHGHGYLVPAIGAYLRMSWGNRAGESPKFHHIAERWTLGLRPSSRSLQGPEEAAEKARAAQIARSSSG